MIIGLTGGIACGKSTVANILRQKGIPVIDADSVSREITKKGEPAWVEIKKEFGKEIIGPDGEILRKKLAQIVFDDPQKLAKLNQITHPRIKQRILEILEEMQLKESPEIIVIEVPLLFESGMENMVDEIWVVRTPEEVAIERLLKRDNLNKEEALKRLKAQLPLEEKTSRADQIINNSGSLEDLERQVDEILKKRGTN